MEDTLIKRIMPNSLEAEQSVIGSMIMDKEAIVSAMEILTKEDFYHQQYGVLFEAMVELFDKGMPVDLVTLQNKLKEKDVPKEIYGLEYVRDIITAVPTSANIKYYANIVKENAVKRRLIRITEDIENECYAGKETLESVLNKTEKDIFALLSSRTGSEFVPIRTVVMNALEKIEKASKQSGAVTGIPTGFVDLDYRTAGLQPSDLVLIAARPSMGKTAFVLNLARNAAVDFNKPVAIFSLEMPAIQLAKRMMVSETKLNADKFKGGEKIADWEWKQLDIQLTRLVKAPIYIDDTPSLPIMEFRSKVKRLVNQKGVKLVVVDYLQLMQGPAELRGMREQEVAAISRMLKATAKEMNVPIIALSQLSRQAENRQGSNRRPQLSDLRESGSIEQDADMVIFIHRFDYQGLSEDSSDVGRTQIIIAKHRNGAIGDIEMRFRADEVRFVDLTDTVYAQADGAGVESAMNSDPAPMPHDAQPYDAYPPDGGFGGEGNFV